jgi:predicted O-methyltransferase YrrM
MSSLFALYSTFPKGFRSPVAEAWSVPPRVLLELVNIVLDAPKPLTVVEFGSGVSTYWIAKAMKLKGAGSLISFEHMDEYAELTRQHLERDDLADVVDLRVSPLAPQEFGGENFIWYQGWEDLPPVDLAFVDGPPANTGPHARQPAMMALREVLEPNAIVLLDDADRPDEIAILERWKTLRFRNGVLSHGIGVERAMRLVLLEESAAGRR